MDLTPATTVFVDESGLVRAFNADHQRVACERTMTKLSDGSIMEGPGFTDLAALRIAPGARIAAHHFSVGKGGMRSSFEEITEREFWQRAQQRGARRAAA